MAEHPDARTQKHPVNKVFLYGWDPIRKRWRPLQVDATGRLVIDPADLDTRYLKVDGSNKMLANLVAEKTYLATFKAIIELIVDAGYPSVSLAGELPIGTPFTSWYIKNEAGTMAFYQGANKRFEFSNYFAVFDSVGVVAQAGDVECIAASKGVVLRDRSTGTRYRLFVDNGVLDIEVV